MLLAFNLLVYRCWVEELLEINNKTEKLKEKNKEKMDELEKNKDQEIKNLKENNDLGHERVQGCLEWVSFEIGISGYPNPLK